MIKKILKNKRLKIFFAVINLQKDTISIFVVENPRMNIYFLTLPVHTSLYVLLCLVKHNFFEIIVSSNYVDVKNIKWYWMIDWLNVTMTLVQIPQL